MEILQIIYGTTAVVRLNNWSLSPKRLQLFDDTIVILRCNNYSCFRNYCNISEQLLQIFDKFLQLITQTTADVRLHNCSVCAKQLQLLDQTNAVVRPNKCICSAIQLLLFVEICLWNNCSCSVPKQQMQMFGQLFSVTIAVIRCIVRCNKCSCSMKQLQLFVELFNARTAVIRCNYCSCLVQLLQVFDRISAVVCPINYIRSLKQLQLFD